MIDIKLVLVKAITLLYLEGQLPDITERSYDLCNNIISHIKLPETYNLPELGRDPVVHLRETLKTMVAGKNELSKPELLQRLRVNLSTDSGLYDSLVTGFNIDLCDDVNIIKENVYSYRGVLRQYDSQTKIKDILRNSYSQAWYQPDTVDWRTFVSEHIESLTPYTNFDSDVTVKHASVVDDIIFGADRDALKTIFEKSVQELDITGVLKFGHQGINKLFGTAGGARRGELIVIQALQHKFKSGLCLEMFKAAALYNTPMMRDPTKKPMLMRISFENPMATDAVLLYRSLVENETGLYVDPRYIDPVEATIYIQQRLEATGYTINMCHIDPSEYGFRDLFDRIEQFEAMGYEIHMLNLDYLAMMSKKGCAAGPAGSEYRDLFRRVRNFMSKRGITVITPHQISTEGKRLLRNGINDTFVQEIANKGYYDSCGTIDQEVDMEIVIHIVEVPGDGSYLTLQVGKHRGPIYTPEKDKYCVYRFEKVATIPDDILGMDASRKVVGGKTMHDGGDAPWFHNL